MQDQALTRALVESAVRKTIKDMQTDTRRSLRNLVELGTIFSSGIFQRDLMDGIRKMLEREESPYYALAKRVIRSVNAETLLTFGMNLGYNGCTRGAITIRENEKIHEVDIPWMIAFQLPNDPEGISEIGEMIAQGKTLGVYTYILMTDGGTLGDALPFLEQHRDCAFVAFSSPKSLTSEALDAVKDEHHLMVSVNVDERGFAAACQRMRKRKMLYAAHHFYDDQNAEQILSGEAAEGLIPAGPAFVLWLAKPGCAAETRDAVYQSVLAWRAGQRYPFIVMDVGKDIPAIDQVVSHGGCSLGFDAQGRMIDAKGRLFSQGARRKDPLLDLLKQYRPKAG